MKYKLQFVLLATLLILNACHQPQNFEFREMKDLQIKHIGFSKSIISTNLLFYNPNNFGINLKKIDCEVYFNQKYLVDYKLDTMMHISSKSTFVIPTNISFDMFDIIKRGISTIMTKEALISIKGTARMGKAGFYKNIPIQYEIKYKLPL